MLGTCDKISVGDALLTPVQECVALTAWPIDYSCSGLEINRGKLGQVEVGEEPSWKNHLGLFKDLDLASVREST